MPCRRKCRGHRRPFPRRRTERVREQAVSQWECKPRSDSRAPARLPIRAVSSEGRTGLLACGYLEKRQANGDVVASEFKGG